MKEHLTRTSKRHILLLLLPIVMIGFLLYTLVIKNKTTSGGKTVTITLTEDGYRPEEVTIEKGDTVVFKTTLNEFFWPASNLHPSHEIYPEFDPQEPVDAKQTWSLTFTKVGTWKYHDHLAPYYTGTITVKEKKKTSDSSKQPSPSLADCGEGEHQACWEEKVSELLRKEGVGSAFEAIATQYEKDPSFANPCHDLTHKVGQAAYLLFAQNKEFEISNKTRYCSFGFYHGFMETLIRKGGDTKSARNFCEYIGKELGDETSSAMGACFHGIGHGWTNIHDKRFWGDERAMVKDSLKLCEQVATNNEELLRCTTGIFDSISIGYYNKQAGLVMREDEPLWLCKEQPERYKEACYRDMMPAIMWLGEHDLTKAVPYVERYVEEAYQSIAMQSLAANSIRFIINFVDPVKSIAICRKARSDLQQECINGVASGVIEHGKPGNEYKEGIRLCGSSDLTDGEAKECFIGIFGYINQLYSKDRMKSICGEVDTNYRQLCFQV
jgi:hypothetical protein